MSSWKWNINGELSDESYLFKEITWKIRNVFRLPKHVDYYAESPSFSFASGSWCLRMYPHGQVVQDSQDYVDLMLVREHSSVSEHEVFCKFNLRTRRGKEFESFCSPTTFTEYTLSNGVVRYLKHSELMHKKSMLVPNDILTVVCQIRTKEKSGVETYSQTELSESDGITFTAECQICNKGKNGVEAYSQTESSESVDNLGKILHDVNLFHDYKELLLSGEDSDVTIRVKGQEFPAHRSILKARCTFFASMFRNNMKEKATGVIDIDDCQPEPFRDFLCFLYSGNMENISVENVFHLYTISDKYDVQVLKSQCLQFIKDNLSVDTFCDTVRLSLRHSETELLNLACDFFAKHLTEIIVTLKWQTFIVENPIQGNELFIQAHQTINK